MSELVGVDGEVASVVPTESEAQADHSAAVVEDISLGAALDVAIARIDFREHPFPFRGIRPRILEWVSRYLMPWLDEIGLGRFLPEGKEEAFSRYFHSHHMEPENLPATLKRALIELSQK